MKKGDFSNRPVPLLTGGKNLYPLRLIQGKPGPLNISSPLDINSVSSLRQSEQLPVLFTTVYINMTKNTLIQTFSTTALFSLNEIIFIQYVLIKSYLL